MNFTAERNADILRAYRQRLAEVNHINMRRIGEDIVNMPSRRFWVSSERAAIVISELLRGKPIPAYTRPPKREMFLEIYRRFLLLRRKNPKETILGLAAIIVNSEAPKFYMSPRSAMEIIYRIKKGF